MYLSAKLLLLLGLLFPFNQQDKQSETITFTVSAIPEIKGDMVFALYKKTDDFPDQPSYFTRFKVTQKGTESFTWKDIPKGQFAVSVYQDINGDDKLNTNFMGIPTEPYAFGNNAMGLMGPPSWEDSKVTVPSSTAIEIKLRN